MLAIKILEIKTFMSKLLTDNAFDQFLLSEASVTTFNTFTIDGYLHKDFFSVEEIEKEHLEQIKNSRWQLLRPLFFQIIKGRKTPLSFKIVFILSPANTERLLQQTQMSLSANDVNGLFLNIKFDGTDLVCTTGTSLTFFTLDKSLDHAWDIMMQRFLTQHQIVFELCQ